MKYRELTPRRHNPLLHRACPKCEARMWLALIEPQGRGQDKLVFECTACRGEEIVVLKAAEAAR